MAGARGPRLRRPRREAGPRDPYEGLPVDELDEPLLPRWFVLTLLVSVPVALVLFVVAFFGLGRGETTAPERRPPPTEATSADVGEVTAAQREPVGHDGACPQASRFNLVGAEADRARLAEALDALCELDVATAALAELAEAGRTTVRFAGFEAAGVEVASDDAVVMLNARLAGRPAAELAPLLAYEARLVTADRLDARAVVDARALEAAVCDELLAEPTRGCEDARAILALDDPIATLREAGFD
ncbi:MAG: hypothetical protein R6T85_04520 [Egibacteraceae bacterium]